MVTHSGLIHIHDEDSFNKLHPPLISEFVGSRAPGPEKLSGEEIDILVYPRDYYKTSYDLHFVKRKAKESTSSRVLALERTMQSRTCRLEILERRINDTNEKINNTNNRIDYDMEMEDEWSKKEEEYKIIIALQESKIEDMAKRQKQLIEKMEKLEERMLNVEFPPIPPKNVNPFDLFIKAN